MKNYIFTLFLVLICCFQCQAQRIEMKKSIFGYKYTQNDKRLSTVELNRLLKPNAQALRLMQNARLTNSVGVFMGFVGSLIIRKPLIAAKLGKPSNWDYIGLGIGMAIVSIPIAINTKKKGKKAIDLYNADLK
jgi:hypothetical protein